jgi:hypothetical protein
LSVTEIGGADRVISSQAGDGVIKGKGDPGLAVSVLFKDNVLGDSSPADADGNFSYVLSDADLQTLGQGGPLQLTLRQVDDYGNIATVVSPEFRIDTIAPNLLVPQRGDSQALGRLDGIVSTQLGDATLKGSGEANRDLLISYNSKLLATVKTSSDGTFSYTLTDSDITTIGQGTAKELELQHSDAAGNVSSQRIRFDVDTLPPSPPQITDVASDAIVSGKASDNVISGTAVAGSEVTLKVYGRPIATVTATTKGSFNYQLSKANIAELGQRSLQVTAQIEDQAGNVALSAPFVFRIDTLAPDTPQITSVGGDDNIVSTQGSGSVTETVDNIVVGMSEAGSSVSIYSGTKLLGTTTANSKGEFSYRLTASNLAGLGQGERKSVMVSATDAAGNTSPISSTAIFSIDTLPPESPRIRSLGGDDGVLSAVAGDNQIIGIAEANATLELLVLNDSKSVFAVPPITTDSKGAWSYAFTSAQLAILEKLLSESKSPQVQVVATDKAGNRGASVSMALAVDITAPKITLSKVGGSDGIVSSIPGDNQINGKAEPNRTITLSSNGNLLGTSKTNSAGFFVYDLTTSNITTIGQGSGRQVVVSQTDSAGNIGTAEANFIIDTVAPGRVTISNLGGADKVVTARSGDYVVTGTAESGTKLAIVAIIGAQRTTLGFTEATKDSSFSYTLTPENLQLIQQGVGKSLMVTSFDQAGNRTDSSPYSYTVEAAWKAGTGNSDVLSFASGVDVLTGLAGTDRFLLTSLGMALVGSAQTPVFDRITDFQIGADQLDGPYAVAAGKVRDLGQIQALSTSHLGKLLSSTAAFPAFGASVFRHQDAQIGERTFLALNNQTAGFDARTDAIIEITGYSGKLTNLQVI